MGPRLARSDLVLGMLRWIGSGGGCTELPGGAIEKVVIVALVMAMTLCVDVVRNG